MGIGTVGAPVGKMGIDVLAHWHGHSAGRKSSTTQTGAPAGCLTPNFSDMPSPRRHSGGRFPREKTGRCLISGVRAASKKNPQAGPAGSFGKGLGRTQPPKGGLIWPGPVPLEEYGAAPARNPTAVGGPLGVRPSSCGRMRARVADRSTSDRDVAICRSRNLRPADNAAPARSNCRQVSERWLRRGGDRGRGVVVVGAC